METGLLDLHNLLRWVILILLLVSIYVSYTGWRQNKPFTAGARRIWLFTLISSHITLLIGIYQWLLGPFGLLKFDLPKGVSVMKNKPLRFFWVEHPLFMILAIVMITLAYGMSKKPVADAVKYKKAFWFFLIALLMILVAVPWPFRELGIARRLFPGMSN